MRFTPTALEGVFIVDLERQVDERGFFARSFCSKEFKAHGLLLDVVQTNVAYSRRKGTLRGLHYQVPPSSEVKLMRCIKGVIYDVIVDMRVDSSTYLQHVGVELSSENHRALYVPPLCAHGYQTLSDVAEVTYLVSEYYNPACERGLRYDDPALDIHWPLPVSLVSEKDVSWPLLGVEFAGVRGIS